MEPARRIVFLTSHVQPFLRAGIDALLHSGNVEVILVHWPSPENAPLYIASKKGLVIHEKTIATKGEIQQKIAAFKPDTIYGPGWMDKDYLRWIKDCRKQGATTIMGMDNQWKGSVKQYFLCLMSRWVLRNIYTHIFIPGTRQLNYARRLGFKEDRILIGLYTPDTSLFNAYFQDTTEQKRENYPRQFLYLGRLIDHKAKNLFIAFSSLNEYERKGWTMLAVGNGPLKDEPYFKTHIKHLPYATQDQLGGIIAECGVGCLTSSDEPWGTVIQEMAAAGLPIIASEQCGASDEFVIRNFNGTICDGGRVESIKESLLHMINQTDEKLIAMAENSSRLGLKTTPEIWAKTVLNAGSYKIKNSGFSRS